MAAELLAKMSSDKLAGPKVKLDLSKFLPQLFSEAIRDAPKQCVHMFESKQENPELIWDENTKAKVSRMVAELKDECVILKYCFLTRVTLLFMFCLSA